MMGERPRSGGAVILLTFLLALILVIFPLPGWAEGLRPQWAALILLYWSLALPSRVGVGIGWLVGLCQDALLGTLLGQHALAFALIAFLVSRLHQHLRLVPVWQQAIAVLALLTAVQLVIFWVNGIIGRPAPDWQAWASIGVGAALWPFIYYGMRSVRRRFQVR